MSLQLLLLEKHEFLPSASFLQSLAEKEKMKKEAAEEKERRKIEREEKKALKEKEKQENKGRRKAKDSLKNGQKAVQRETLMMTSPSKI